MKEPIIHPFEPPHSIMKMKCPTLSVQYHNSKWGIQRPYLFKNQACLSFLNANEKIAHLEYYVKPIKNWWEKEILEWIVKGEQWGKAFITKDLDEGIAKGFIVDVDQPSAMTHGALCAIRFMYEQKHRMSIYKQARKRGCTIPEAYLLSVKLSRFEPNYPYMQPRLYGNLYQPVTFELHGSPLDPNGDASLFLQNKPDFVGPTWRERGYILSGAVSHAFNPLYQWYVMDRGRYVAQIKNIEPYNDKVNERKKIGRHRIETFIQMLREDKV